MLTVTEAVSARLAQMPDQKGLPDEVAIRFVYEGQGIALHRDSERAGDATSSTKAGRGCFWMPRYRSCSQRARSMSKEPS